MCRNRFGSLVPPALVIEQASTIRGGSCRAKWQRLTLSRGVLSQKEKKKEKNSKNARIYAENNRRRTRKSHYWFTEIDTQNSLRTLRIFSFGS